MDGVVFRFKDLKDHFFTDGIQYIHCADSIVILYHGFDDGCHGSQIVTIKGDGNGTRELACLFHRIMVLSGQKTI